MGDIDYSNVLELFVVMTVHGVDTSPTSSSLPGACSPHADRQEGGRTRRMAGTGCNGVPALCKTRPLAASHRAAIAAIHSDDVATLHPAAGRATPLLWWLHTTHSGEGAVHDPPLPQARYLNAHNVWRGQKKLQINFCPFS